MNTQHDFYTLDDFDFKDKTVLLRVDINCPISKDKLEIINDVRIRSIVPTVRELIGKRAKLVILAHQSRKGKWDCIGLEQHAKKLSRNLNIPVKYVNDVIGDEAKKAIKALEPGQVLLLGNVREIDSESEELDMYVHAEGEIVRELTPLIDYYVCDAFGAAHRSQCSLVGFQIKVPSASGRLMARELYALQSIFNNPRRPSVFILGGAKFGDVPHMIDVVMEHDMADTVIIVGLAGNAFLYARGVDIGEASSAILKEELTPENINTARAVISKYGSHILLPVDVAVERNGKRVSVNIGDMPTPEPALDIGDQSIEKFQKVIESSQTSFMSGPAGMFEKPGFEVGTRALMEAMVNSKGLSVIGGGHTAGAAEKFDYADRMSYLSTGGGALEAFLLREPMPVIEALKQSKKVFKADD
ncbi:MAG: phosphoglycerate kinase [Candidatus Methanogranum gryphiswaldense]|jgi:phosphoglycerate kinase|nr:MAG: phosphoglycerate kinase [Candidatus Methanogranum sp. U3.2.1]